MERLPSPNILLADRTPGDLRSELEAISQTGVCVNVTVMRDHLDVLRLLEHAGGNPKYDPPPVHLVLLDLDLPRVGGHALVRHIKSDPRTERIPVLVMAEPHRAEEAALAMACGAKRWLKKPLDPYELRMELKTAGDYWLRLLKRDKSDRRGERGLEGRHRYRRRAQIAGRKRGSPVIGRSWLARRPARLGARCELQYGRVVMAHGSPVVS